MEQKEIRIECPEGYEIDKEKSTFERIVFKVKENSLPKTWEELVFIPGWSVNDTNEITNYGTCPAWHTNKKLWPTKELAEAALALAQLLQLRDRYNDGWVPDWNNSIDKFTIYTQSNHILSNYNQTYHHVLAFKTRTLRDEFLTNFKDLIEIAKPLL
jgi:hypothetical protein